MDGGATATISSKRQITLPAAMARELGIGPGDKLVVCLEEGCIVLRPRPRGLVEYVGGSAGGLYGQTREEIDAYIDWVRQGDPPEAPESGGSSETS